MKSICFSCIAALLLEMSALAQDPSTSALHISRAVPVRTASQTLSAIRPNIPPDIRALPRPNSTNVTANNWQLLATLPGTVIHDLTFASAAVGYAAAEGGQVWKTSNGGKAWTEVLNLGYPYYFYGVAALNTKTLVISGFIDSATEQAGVLRWTEDGGQTWSSDVTFPSMSLQRVRFANSMDGLMFDLGNGTVQYTTDGGATSSDWTTEIANPTQGWFGFQFSFLPNLHARAS